jgi:beta-N-acetylhexosaminidase
VAVAAATAATVALIAAVGGFDDAHLRPENGNSAKASAESGRATVRSRPRRPTRAIFRPPRGSWEARLSLSQLAGQRIIYAYSGLNPPPLLFARIRAGEAAGVIFFARNISSPAQLRSVIGEFQRANASGRVHAPPLLMLTDQEGGLVRRLPGQPTLSEKQIGASPSEAALATHEGKGAGENLRSVGITVNLAPVLDVFRAQGNFIDAYQRSYGSSPARVARLATAFITAQQATGVAATVKHFPGLGAATSSQNTDSSPVTLDLSTDQLRSVDEAPYRTAIAAGAKLVMVSWATYPALDPHLPAGLSRIVIQDELRNRLGFHQVTITDDLGAGALITFGGFGERAVLATRAGADLLICSTQNVSDNTPAAGIAALNGLAAALAAHTLDRTAARQAVARVIHLRSNP